MDEYVVNLESKMGQLKDRFTDKKSSSPTENASNEVVGNETTVNAIVYLNK